MKHEILMKAQSADAIRGNGLSGHANRSDTGMNGARKRYALKKMSEINLSQ